MKKKVPYLDEDARELYEDAPCGYLSSLLDGTIVGVNRTFLQWTGYSREELLAGTKFQDLLTNPGKIFYETQYAPLLLMQGFLKEIALDLVCKGREPLPIIVNSVKREAVREVGSGTGSGREVYVRSTLFDATARRRYEKDLIEARRRLEEDVRARTVALESEVEERRKAESGLRELTAKLLRMQDEERRRIARDLHDSVGQLLAATSMNLVVISREGSKLSSRAGKSLTEASEMVEQSLKEIRIVSYLLHPPLLDDSGLASALEWYLDGYSQRSSVAAELKVSDGFGRLPEEMETALFRIVQECLTNIHRHSGSGTAAVRLTRDAVSVRLEVEDSGKGMTRGPSKGVGLRGMRERIVQLRGKLEIRSGGEGTTIVAEIPLQAAATEE